MKIVGSGDFLSEILYQFLSLNLKDELKPDFSGLVKILHKEKAKEEVRRYWFINCIDKERIAALDRVIERLK